MRVAVVGGGTSGLVSAYVLAKAGVKVVLYEKKGYLGGHAMTVNVDGLDLDLGFMALNRVLSALLSLLHCFSLYSLYITHTHSRGFFSFSSFIFIFMCTLTCLLINYKVKIRITQGLVYKTNFITHDFRRKILYPSRVYVFSVCFKKP